MFKPSRVMTPQVSGQNRAVCILPVLKAGRPLFAPQPTSLLRGRARRVGRSWTGQNRPFPRRRRAPTTLALTALIFGLGCRAVPSQPPFDLARPGWSVWQGQAVWRSRADAPDLAGELLVATHPDGRSLVQFTKVPFPLILAQATRRSWQIEFAAENRRYAGRGEPPSALIWFELVRSLNGRGLSKGWSFSRQPEDGWRLEHGSTGEVLEGYLAPASPSAAGELTRPFSRRVDTVSFDGGEQRRRWDLFHFLGQ